MPSPTTTLRSRAAIKRLQSLIVQLEDAPDAGSRAALTAVAEAQLGVAEHLVRLKRYAEAEKSFADAATSFAAAQRPQRVLRVRVRQAAVLMVAERPEEALAATEQAINAGGRVEAAADVLLVAHLWRVAALRELGRREEALSKARRMVKRFGPGSTAPERQVVAKALLLESELAFEGGDRAGALRAANKLLGTYAEDRSPSDDLEETLARAQQALAMLESG